jgi:TatD DNase family protein
LLTDTHCHLDFDAFENDRDQVLDRARKAGLTRILDPGIDLETSQAAVKLSESYPEVYAAIGVHPNSARTWGEKTLTALEEIARHPKVVAIGEVGLDYYRDRAPKDVQQRVFRQQLDLAAQLRLPVIVHCREAAEDTLAILSEWRATLDNASPSLARRPGVLHSFTGDAKIAQQATRLDFLIGITGTVTFTNARNLQQIVATLPLSRLLIETDAPFLAPHPHRGQRNEPAYVRLVAERLAVLLGQPFETVVAITTKNATDLFYRSD